MAAQVELLDKQKHQQIKIKTGNMDTPENRVNAALVVVTELSTLIHEYPIFATKHPNTGQFQLVAILGFSPKQNLYLHGEQWRATYLPLDIMRRPFSAMIENDDFSAGRIAIDVNHPWVNTQTGEALFTAEGKATEFLQRMQNTFAGLLAGTQRTQQILNVAAEHKLLTSINLEVELKNGEKTGINGLYAVDTDALKNLSGDGLATCHKASVLEVCHLLLSSGAHIQKLIKWADEA
ncbi:SapC family protein [Catenovulum sp. 2E275]|uniref:SapC family protein n=1 Tax=Catenovulum sp. 2E275 TaxID=2980497 RepID=UPI0021CF86DA|nr:SapC family protein [Catenovulum sp. 2E275]MCU4675612.1 SapC family protein [Catenovulum sp. 2E275]